MALQLQNATELMSTRRDAVLHAHSSLLQISKDRLRAAPLDSKLLLGGRVAAVTVSDASEQSRRLSASAVSAFAQGQKRSATSTFKSKPKKPVQAKKHKRDPKAFVPRQSTSTGTKSAKPKAPFKTGSKNRQPSKYSAAPRPQP